MRIGIVTGEYPPMRGGISTQTRLLAGQLAEAGHTVRVFSSVNASEAVPGVELTASVEKWRYATMRTLREWSREVDVVNIHYQTAAYGMSPWIHFTPEFSVAPVVSTLHDLRFPYLFPKAGPFRNWVVTRLARASAGVVVTNQEDEATLGARNALRGNHALVPILSNVTAEPMVHVTARQQLGLDGFVVAFFGFVNHSKGLDVLLRSVAAVREMGIPVQLVMLGEPLGDSDPTNAEYAEDIHRLINRQKLDVTWTGYLDDEALAVYLSAVDAVVMPFRDGASYRRSSMTIALHCGAALVTTQPVVDVPAFVDGENMLLVPREDDPALTDALLRFYNSPALRNRLRNGARELSGTVFSWERALTDYTKLYEQVLA